MTVQRLSIQPETATAVRMDAASEGLQVLVALPEGHDVLSLAILLDLLAATNRRAGAAAFSCKVLAENQIPAALRRLEAAVPANRLLLLVADAEGAPPHPPDLVAALGAVWRKGGQVGGWGAGCLALAQAGLLEGRRFALSPSLRGTGLRPCSAAFCVDDRVLTSVGKTLVSDLALHLIEARCGRAAMIAAMDHCLIRRTPGDSAPGLDLVAMEPDRIDPRIATLDRWIDRNIAQRFRACDLAPRVGLSSRQLERLFQRHLRRSPADHLEHKRMTLALRLLRETELGLDDIARSTGHPCPATFRRRFKRKFGIAPQRY